MSWNIASNRMLAGLFLVCACAGTRRSPQTAMPVSGSRWSAIELDAELRRLAAVDLWPGFDPRTIPLAVFDGEKTFLFRHPSPPAGFLRLDGGDSITWVMTGRHESVTANSSAEIGGASTATVMLVGGQANRTVRDAAALAIHESFHVFQRARHPAWSGNEGNLFTYPTDSVSLLASRRLETAALRRALDAPDVQGAQCHAREAMAIRLVRFAAMDSAFAAYERGTELNEGLATYVEQRSLGRTTSELPATDFPAASIRQRAYAIGPALAQLLDRLSPGWQTSFESNDRQTLDGALLRAVGAGETCATAAAARESATAQARADIAALLSNRELKRTSFEKRAGWTLVVETGNGEPLWPQGFDPLNVERVGAIQVLHSRFLALGNSVGKLEVLGASALTFGVGPHALFQGVNRLLLTGLPKPVLVEADGRVRVSAPGLSLDFRKSRLVRDGETIRVCVGC